MPSLKIDLVVSYIDGGEVNATAYMAEMMEFERKYQVPWSAFLNPAEMRLEYPLYVAWLAVVRNGESRDFEAWAKTVAGVDVVTEAEDDADPLDPTPSTDF